MRVLPPQRVDDLTAQQILSALTDGIVLSSSRPKQQPIERAAAREHTDTHTHGLALATHKLTADTECYTQRKKPHQ